MRKKLCLFFMIILVAVGVLGCRKAVVPAVVVRAEITYEHGGETLYRCYTQQEKLGSLLVYLRQHRFCGYAREDPEQVAGDRCRIELTRYDGTKTVILQNANRYRSTDHRAWEKVDEEQAQMLYPFLQSLPGDVSGT